MLFAGLCSVIEHKDFVLLVFVKSGHHFQDVILWLISREVYVSMKLFIHMSVN